MNIEQMLNDFKNELESLTKKYEFQEPFNTQLINELLQSLNDFYADAYDNINILTRQSKNLSTTFKGIIDNYSTYKTASDQKVKKIKTVIDKKYDVQYNEIDLRINKLDKNGTFSYFDFKKDESSAKNSNLQRYQFLKNDYDQQKIQLDYENTESKHSYSANVDVKGDALKKVLDDLTKQNEQYLAAYDKDCIELSQKINNVTFNLRQKLKEYEALGKEYEKNYKIQCREESIKLNAIIRDLNNERLNNNQAAKDEYSSSLSQSDIEKENLRKKQEDEMRILTKDFVTKVNVIEEKFSAEKKMHDENYTKSKTELFYSLLKIKKDEEIALTNAYNNNYNKLQIRKIKKEFYNKIQEEKNNSNAITQQLQNSFNKKADEFNYQKTVLEIKKNSEIKSMHEEEQCANKIRQEKANYAELLMNKKIVAHDAEYNKKANQAKAKSMKQNLIFEEEYNKLTLKNENEVKKITLKIKQNDLEAEFVETLREMIHKKDSKKFTKTINYKTVYSSLQVEKYKNLLYYNQKLYDLNLKNTTLILDYSKKRLDLKDEEFSDLTNSTIQMNQEKINKEIALLEHKKELLRIKCIEENKTFERNTQYENDYKMYEIIYKRFSEEIKLINQITFCFIALTKKLFGLTSFYISILYKINTLKRENSEVIKIFISEILNKINNFSLIITKYFMENQNVVFEDRLSFEEKFKFKSSYDEIKLNYEKELEDRSQLVDVYNSRIDETIEEINKSRFNIQAYDKQIKKLKSYKVDSSVNENEIFNLKLSLKEESSKIISLEQQKKNLQNDKIENQKKLIQLKTIYNEQENKIKKLQFESSKTFKDLNNLFITFFNQYDGRVNIILNSNISSYSLENMPNICSTLVQSLKSLHEESFIKLYEMTNNFCKNTVLSITRDKKTLLLKYKYDLTLICQDIENKIKENASKRKKTEDKFNLSISQINGQFKHSQQEALNKQNILNEQFKTESNQILSEKKAAEQNFYLSYEALTINGNDLTINFNNYIKNLVMEYETKKKDYINLKYSDKTKLVVDYTAIINNNNDTMANIPIIYKEKRINIDDDLKNKNRDIQRNELASKIKYDQDLKISKRKLDVLYSTSSQTTSSIKQSTKIELRNLEKNFKKNSKKHK